VWRDIFASSINLKFKKMKTAILTATLMILMTAATYSAPADSVNSNNSQEQYFKVWVNQPSGDIIKFRVIKPSEEKVVLKIYGEKNNKIYQRTIKKDKGLELTCDMSDFTRGNYTCVVERNGKEVVRKPITLE
jgi:hypothetical protein